MGEYRVEVGSFVTRFVVRNFTVTARSEDEARRKAIEKYDRIEMKLPSSVDSGSPQVDKIIKIK